MANVKSAVSHYLSVLLLASRGAVVFLAVYIVSVVSRFAAGHIEEPARLINAPVGSFGIEHS